MIPEPGDVLNAVSFVGNLLIADYLKDSRTQVVLSSPTGERIDEVTLPGALERRPGLGVNGPIRRRSIPFPVLRFHQVFIV